MLFKNPEHIQNKGYDKIFFNTKKTTEIVVLFNYYF